LIVRCRKEVTIRHDRASRRRGFAKATEGSVAVEYGLIAALIVAVIIGTVVQVRDGLLNLPFPALIAAFTNALSG